MKQITLILLCISSVIFITLFKWNDENEDEDEEILMSRTLKDYQKIGYKPRFKSLEEIHQFIRKQIHSLQEEGECENKKILLCRNVGGYYGFGSNVHRYGVCMQVAYGLGRTFFIQQDEYNHFGGVFQWVKPESLKCGHLKNKYLSDKLQVCNAQSHRCYLKNGYDINNTYRVIEFNTIYNKLPYPRHIPGTIPENLKQNLLYLGVKSPWLWFTSQFLAYLLLRPNTDFQNTFMTLKEQIGYSMPIVGFHIRHGDKLTSGEAEYVNESLFVKHAEDYFNQQNASSKRVYIATDDIPAINVVKKLAPDFLITSLPQSYLTIGLGNYFSKNFSKKILESTLIDLYFLTRVNYLICDITSNLCRLAFELKQGLPPFKQYNMFKPVGVEKDVYYRWHDFIYPSSLWMLSSPSLSKSYNNIWIRLRCFLRTGKLLMKYENSLYSKIQTVHKYSDMWYMKKIGDVIKKGMKYVYTSARLGYVLKKDVMEWPGKPSYHFSP